MKRLLTLLFISVLLLTFTACGGSSDSSGETTENADKPQKLELAKTYEIDDIKIQLNQVGYSTYTPTNMGTNLNAPEGKYYLVTSWTLLNDSDSDIPISTENFTCYVDNSLVDTSSATFMLPDYSFTGLDTLAAGRQFDGYILYEIPQTWNTIEIEFKPNMFTDDKLTYELTPDMVTNLDAQ